MEKESSGASFEDFISDSKGAKKAGLTVFCDLSPEEFKAGFRPLEKQRRLAKNQLVAFVAVFEFILMTAIWLVVFLLFGKKLLQEDFISLVWLSIGLFSSLLFFPIRYRIDKDFFEFLSIFSYETKCKFSVEFYDDLVWIERADKVISEIPYKSAGCMVTEYDESFVITSSDQNMYIIPKCGLNEEKMKKIRIYAKKFKERYIDKTRRR